MVAALTSTISLAEVSVAFLQDHFGMGRLKACLSVMLPLTVLSTLCSLSQGVLSGIRVMGMNLFDFLDNTATNIMLPVAAIFTCVFAGWIVPRSFIRKELTNSGRISGSLVPVVLFIVRYAAPALIAVILLSRFIS